MAHSFCRFGAIPIRNQRERLLFIAASGLAFSLLVLMLAVLNLKTNNAVALQKHDEFIPAAAGTVKLFVPDRVVNPGTPLNEVAFKEAYWPMAHVPPQSVMDLAEFKNQFARTMLSPDTPIRRTNLTANPLMNGLSVTPGNRAVSIEVDATSSIEGHAIPGSRVDVVALYREEGEVSGTIIVENARVLSLGGEARAPNKHIQNVAAIQSKTITLDVAPADALKITTASAVGKLQLLLRDGVENHGSQTITVRTRDFMGRENSRHKVEERSCKSGTMKVRGETWQISCGGEITKLEG